MRLFLKFSLLLSLILAGRFMQPTSPASVSNSRPASSLTGLASGASSLIRYASYADATDTTTTWAKQRRRPALTLY